MKIFIWEHLGNVSENYHPGGGVVIIAESIDKAKLLAKENHSIEDPLPTPNIILNLHPMHRDMKEQLIVFPDAGCC